MRSVRFKLTLAFLIVGLLGLAVGAVFASRTASGAFQRFTFARNQEDIVARFVSYFEEHGSWEGLAASFPPFQRHVPGAPQIPLREPGVLLVTDAEGRILLPVPGREVGEQVADEVLGDAMPIKSGGATVGWLMVPHDAFAPTRGEQQFLGQLNTALIVGSLGALMLSVLLGAILARSLTRPLQDLTDATRAVADGDLRRKVQVRSRDEIGTLATSFNRMSDALDQSQRLRRQMTADIAHELRTPLSIIVGHLDAVDEGVLPANAQTIGIMREEAARLARLIDDLRTLSLADAGELSLERTTVKPGAMLRRSAAAHQPAALAAGIELAVEAAPDLPPVSVDAERMAQVLGNLLDNAMLQVPRGGRIVLAARRADDGVELRVRDNGPGIPPEDLGLVFERLYRSNASRQRYARGSGLGLAIAKSLVEAHGGSIRAESTPGAGTTMVVTLPAGASGSGTSA
jgi:two-component system sensor histidine kinase BaeS